jgi:hypothetical protein
VRKKTRVKMEVEVSVTRVDVSDLTWRDQHRSRTKRQRGRHKRGRRSLDGRRPNERLRRLRWRWRNYRRSRRW